MQKIDYPFRSLNSSFGIRLSRYNCNNIEPVIGDLFQRSFGSPPPDFPAHFVCLGVENGAESVLGYGHCTVASRYYLGGGMCSDMRAQRRLSASARRAIKDAGGTAQFLVEEIFRTSVDTEAVFAYVGHRGALEIDLRAGFQLTRYKHLIVHWQRGTPADADALIDEVHALGPF